MEFMDNDQDNPRVEFVVGYRDGKRFARLCLDIPLPDSDVMRISDYLELAEWDRALRELKKVAPLSTHAAISILTESEGLNGLASTG